MDLGPPSRCRLCRRLLGTQKLEDMLVVRQRPSAVRRGRRPVIELWSVFISDSGPQDVAGEEGGGVTSRFSTGVIVSAGSRDFFAKFRFFSATSETARELWIGTKRSTEPEREGAFRNP